MCGISETRNRDAVFFVYHLNYISVNMLYYKFVDLFLYTLDENILNALFLGGKIFKQNLKRNIMEWNFSVEIRINVSHVQTSEFMYILPAAPNVNLLEAWINNEIYLSLFCVVFLSLSHFDMKFAFNDWNDWLIIIVYVKYSYSISLVISTRVDLLAPVNCFFLKYLIPHQHRLQMEMHCAHFDKSSANTNYIYYGIPTQLLPTL